MAGRSSRPRPATPTAGIGFLSSLLNALHESFNGKPDNINVAMGLMYALRIEAVSLMSTELNDGTGLTAGPSYQYVNVQGGMGLRHRFRDLRKVEVSSVQVFGTQAIC